MSSLSLTFCPEWDFVLSAQSGHYIDHVAEWESEALQSGPQN